MPARVSAVQSHFASISHSVLYAPPLAVGRDEIQQKDTYVTGVLWVPNYRQSTQSLRTLVLSRERLLGLNPRWPSEEVTSSSSPLGHAWLFCYKYSNCACAIGNLSLLKAPPLAVFWDAWSPCYIRDILFSIVLPFRYLSEIAISFTFYQLNDHSQKNDLVVQ